MTRNVIITALLLCSLVSSAQAALLVDTGEPDNVWPSLFVGGYGQAGQISQALAGRFTLNGTHDIYSMQGYLAVNVQGLVQVSILADVDGRPGDTLMSGTFMSASDQYPYFYGWQGTTGVAGRLDAGNYWIAFGAALDSPFQGGMGRTGLAAPVMQAEATMANMGSGLGWSSWFVVPLDSGPDTGLGVYARIYGNPVPVPAAAWMLAGAIVTLAGAARRRLH